MYICYYLIMKMKYASHFKEIFDEIEKERENLMNDLVAESQ